VEIRIRTARPEDAGELAKIESLCSRGKSIVYHYQRHDFFARSKEYRRWIVFVAEAGNVIVGMAAASVKNIAIAQKFVTAGYIYDLKVHPRWRRRGISYLLLKQIESYLRTEKISYAYAYLPAENTAAKKISNNLDVYYCGDFKALYIQCIPTPGPKIRMVTGTEMKKIIPELEMYFKKHDFRERKPLSVQYKKTIEGSPFAGTFSLADSLHTTASVWDDSSHSTSIIDRRPISLGILDKISNTVKKKFNIPQFPGKGDEVVIRSLFDIRQKTDDPSILLDFIHGMQTYLYSRGVHLLVIYMDTRDPLYKTLKQTAFSSMSGRILMRTSITGELPPLLHHLYIDVRDMQ
jgi:GNAT superfamily N-acetyltransferase